VPATAAIPEIVVKVETTVTERVAAFKAGNGRLNGDDSPWQFWLPRLICFAMVIGGFELMGSHPIPAVLLIVSAYAGLILWVQRRRYQAIARSAAAHYTVTANAEGLRIASPNGEARVLWAGVESIESRGDALMLFLRNYQSVMIPHRSFASDDDRHAFVTLVESASAHTVRDTVVDTEISPTTSFSHALFSNLQAGLLLLGLRSKATQYVQGSVPQLIALLLVAILISLSAELHRVGLDGQFNPYALASEVYGVTWLLLAAWATARLAGNPKSITGAAVGVQALWCWLALVVQLMSFLPQHWWHALGDHADLVWWLPFAYGMFASLLALIRITGLPTEQRVGAVLIVVYLMAVPFLVAPRQTLWVAREDTSDKVSAEQRERWEAPTREAILYSQPRLIEQTIARIKPGTPGKPELFLLALGGHGNQDVFMREVKSVQQLFSERFGTTGHSAVLLNNPTTLKDYPLASVTSIDETLQGMAQRMNRDEDVLFLFMTSHGGDDFRFDLSMWPFQFDDLTPQRLKAALDKAGIRHRVVIVSSCYSGGFVPPLADAETWVMTAARADRNSHGCSHEADWTFFGRAFFAEALHQTRSFEQAFEMAKKTIAEREKAEGLTPSEPQTGGGEAVKPLLRKIAQGLGG
jgi:hypothetical protein